MIQVEIGIRLIKLSNCSIFWRSDPTWTGSMVFNTFIVSFVFIRFACRFFLLFYRFLFFIFCYWTVHAVLSFSHFPCSMNKQVAGWGTWYTGPSLWWKLMLRNQVRKITTSDAFLHSYFISVAIIFFSWLWFDFSFYKYSIILNDNLQIIR